MEDNKQPTEKEQEELDIHVQTMIENQQNAERELFAKILEDEREGIK